MRFAAQKGKVYASETNAKASTTEATASESGAQSMKTKAGACDIQSKAMKMNYEHLTTKALFSNAILLEKYFF